MQIKQIKYFLSFVKRMMLGSRNAAMITQVMTKNQIKILLAVSMMAVLLTC